LEIAVPAEEKEKNAPIRAWPKGKMVCGWEGIGDGKEK
jgi:hypothetical protein